MAKMRPLNRFIIPSFYKALQANQLSPQDSAALSGLSLITVKTLRQSRPVTKAVAVKVLESVQLLDHIPSSKYEIVELSPKDISGIKRNRRDMSQRRKRFGSAKRPRK